MLRQCYKNIKYFLRGGWIILLLCHMCSTECKGKIQEDFVAYTRKSRNQSMLDVVFDETKKPFRNVLYYRFSTEHLNRRLRKLCCFFIPPLSTIEIGGDIDGGLKIIHNYCVISVKKAGKNLTVLQGVTVGKNITGGPSTIGNDVMIYANATVFGNINIGDKVIIGAGALVNKDIPSNATVIGNPLRIVR